MDSKAIDKLLYHKFFEVIYGDNYNYDEIFDIPLIKYGAPLEIELVKIGFSEKDKYIIPENLKKLNIKKITLIVKDSGDDKKRLIINIRIKERYEELYYIFLKLLNYYTFREIADMIGKEFFLFYQFMISRKKPKINKDYLK